MKIAGRKSLFSFRPPKLNMTKRKLPSAEPHNKEHSIRPDIKNKTVE